MNTRQMGVFLLVAILLVSLVACALPGLPGTDPLKGTSWRLVSIGGSGLIPGTEITAKFEDGQVGGSACNSYGGSYEVSGDKITISELSQTEMACVDPQGIMEQERKYLEFLSMAQSFQLSSAQLSIFSAGGDTLTFVPAS
jgi:heat shock protein HslJ